MWVWEPIISSNFFKDDHIEHFFKIGEMIPDITFLKDGGSPCP